MEEYARLHFGDLALMFDPNAQGYWIPAMPNIGDITQLTEAELIQYKEEEKLRIRDIYDMKRNRPKLFAAMWMQLSDESRQKIMEAGNYETEIRRGDDPFKLWKAIKETHMSIGSASVAINSYHAVEAYQALRMESYETLSMFMERFRAAIDTITSIAGALAVPSQSSQAVSFIMKLDDRFYRFKDMLKNNDAMGIGKLPDTLLEAYTSASRFLTANP
jgi:hypothetical protein